MVDRYRPQYRLQLTLSHLTVASQSERDYGRYLRRRLNARMERACSGQMAREVHAVLGPVGVDEKVSLQVAKNLLDAESASRFGSGRQSRSGSRPSSSHSVDERTRLINAGPDVEEQAVYDQDVGITAFLLKFGEGMGTYYFRRLPQSPHTCSNTTHFQRTSPLVVSISPHSQSVSATSLAVSSHSSLTSSPTA